MSYYKNNKKRYKQYYEQNKELLKYKKDINMLKYNKSMFDEKYYNYLLDYLINKYNHLHNTIYVNKLPTKNFIKNYIKEVDHIIITFD